MIDEHVAFEELSLEDPIQFLHNLVESVDFEAQTVLVTGRKIHYSLLVIATGMAAPEVFAFGNRKTNKSSREDLLASVDSFKESVYNSLVRLLFLLFVFFSLFLLC
jgi:hypothetical protein